MNFWKRYPADYRKKTARLTLAMHGAYTLLLDEVYITEQPLPAEIDELYQICHARTKLERDAVDTVAQRYFPIGEDGQRHNERATEELEEAAPAVEAARANGKKGGRPKTKPSGNPVGSQPENPVGFQEQTQTKPSSKPPHSSELREENPPAAQGPPKAKPSKRCPETFAVTAELVGWAKQHAPGVDIPRETMKLRNHQFARGIVDWVATWQNWILRAYDEGPGKARGNGGKGFRERDSDHASAHLGALTGGLLGGGARPARVDVIEMEVGRGPLLEHD